MSIQRHAQILWGLTFLLLIAGSLVHGTGSGLACPDWPLCHGVFFPEMTGGVEFEHTHRLVAGAVALLTLALSIRLWKTRWRWLGLAAIILVLVQAALGGLTVLMGLPAAVSIIHSAVSLLFFSLVTRLALVMVPAVVRSPAPTAPHPAPMKVSGRPVAMIQIIWLVLYAQMVLGAVVRFLGAGLACPDIPFCRGQIWPPVIESLGRLHMIHRGVALVVAALIIGMFIDFRRRFPENQTLRWASSCALILVIVQIGLGVASVISFLNLVPVTAHLAVGALLLASLTAMVVSTSAIASPKKIV